MAYYSAEEAKQKLIDELGEDFGNDLNYLKDSYLNMRVSWRFYRSLFGNNKETIDLLNSVSGIFFRYIEQALFEQTILGLCRLTDPIEIGKGAKAKKNLTYRMLEEYLPEGYICAVYVEKLEAVKELGAFARDWRNRRIAHSDYQVIRGESELDEASRKSVQNLLDAIGDLLQFIYQHILHSDILLETTLPLSDEITFLEHLYDASIERGRIAALNEAAVSEKRYKDYIDGPVYPKWLGGNN